MLGVVFSMSPERGRERDRQIDRERERQRERESGLLIGDWCGERGGLAVPLMAPAVRFGSAPPLHRLCSLLWDG